MDKQILTLAVDIGNTNTHAGLIDCSNLACLAIDVFPTSDIEELLVKSLLKVAQTQDSQSLPVMLCSVVEHAKPAAMRALNASRFLSIKWLEQHPAFPVSVIYKNPERLGSDRLANCLYGFAAYPGKNQILIDAGTAITVDFLKEGNQFCGGVILPGVSTQLKSLHNNTSALPQVSLPLGDIEFPATSTEQCMASGVLFGVAGALTHIVDKYKTMFGSDGIVLATGGSWQAIEPFVKFDLQHVPMLTLIGTALFINYSKRN